MVLPLIFMVTPCAKNNAASTPLSFIQYRAYAYQEKEGTEKIDTYQKESVK
jgi:hypothetical protein